MKSNILSKDIPDLHSYLRWNSISKFIDYSLYTLDVGCNIGTMSIEIAKRSSINVNGIDIDKKVVDEAKIRANKHGIKNCQFNVGSATELPFDNETFEQILLADILEYCNNDSLVIQESYRVLKTNGKLIINIPRPIYSQLFNAEWVKRIGHVRDGYELLDIAKLTHNYFIIDSFDFNSRAKEEIDKFYNKGIIDLSEERIDKILEQENSNNEPYGITIKLTKRNNIIAFDKKQKILNVAWGHPPNFGAGPIYYLHNLCLQQNSSGLISNCFVAHNDPKVDQSKPYIEKIVYEGVNYYTVKNRYAHYFNWENPESEIENIDIELLFEKILLVEMPDIVHFHNLVGLCMSLVKIAKDFGAMTFFSLHNYWMLCPRDDFFAPNEEPCSGPNNGAKCASCVSNNEKVEDFIYRIKYSKDILNNYTDQILAVSNRVKEIFVSNNISSEKIIVNHIGSKIAELNWNIHKSNNKIKINNEGEIVFGFLGSLSVRKGAHILIDAVKYLSKYENKFRVNIYGYCPPGSYERRLNLLIQSDEFLKSHINLKGGYSQKDISEISDQINIPIIPSIWEDNGPQTVIEMLSAGKPIIGANIGGIPDFVKDNINGLLYKANSAVDLSCKMREIIESPDLIAKLEKGINPPITMQDHSNTLQSYYEMLRNKYLQDKITNDYVIITSRSNSTKNRGLDQCEQQETVNQPKFANDLLKEVEDLINRRKLGQAKKILSLILKKEPENNDILNDLSVVNILENKNECAIEIINKILVKDSNNKTAINNLKYLRGLNTEEILDKENIFESVSQLLVEAENDIQSKNFDEALAKLSLILQKDQRNLMALNDLSVIFILQKDFESALKLILKIIELNPKDEIANSNLRHLNNKIKESANNHLKLEVKSEIVKDLVKDNYMEKEISNIPIQLLKYYITKSGKILNREEILCFLSGLFNIEDNYLGPHKNRLVETILRSASYLNKDDKVLEVGSYKHVPLMLYEFLDIKNIKACALDGGYVGYGENKIFNESNQKVKFSFNIDNFNIEKDIWPYNDEEFDVILIFEVLEHMQEHPQFMMNELNRVLKNNGILILTTPNSNSYRAILNILYGQNPYLYNVYIVNRQGMAHVKEYSINELDTLVQYSGFNIVAHNTFSPYIDDKDNFMPEIKMTLLKAGMSNNMIGSTHFLVAVKKSTPLYEYYEPLYTETKRR